MRQSRSDQRSRTSQECRKQDRVMRKRMRRKHVTQPPSRHGQLDPWWTLEVRLRQIEFRGLQSQASKLPSLCHMRARFHRFPTDMMFARASQRIQAYGSSKSGRTEIVIMHGKAVVRLTRLSIVDFPDDITVALATHPTMQSILARLDSGNTSQTLILHSCASIPIVTISRAARRGS